jgi:hypothetical protein
MENIHSDIFLWAIRYNCIDILETIFSHHSKFNVNFNDGEALMLCSRTNIENPVKMFRYLIEKGGVVTSAPFFEACKYGSFLIVCEYLKNYELTESDFKTGLELAVENNHLQIVKILSYRLDLLNHNKIGFAINKDFLELSKFLVSICHNNLSIDEKIELTKLAIERDNLEVCVILFPNCGEQFISKTYRKSFLDCLKIAMKRESFKTFTYVFNSSLSQFTYDEKMSLLKIAIDYGRFEFGKFLMTKIDINANSNFLKYSLLISTICENFEILELLLEKTEFDDPNVVKDAFEWAISVGNLKLTNLFFKKFPDLLLLLT